jgi:hypothetical protein
MTKRGVEQAVLKLVRDTAPRPVSTREIAGKLKIAWHTADRYCLKLQLKSELDSFTIGKSTAWFLKK